MTEFTSNLVDAIIDGSATGIESSFQAVMADKIASAIEDRKIEVAQTMFKNTDD
jgi:hypothetical protein